MTAPTVRCRRCLLRDLQQQAMSEVVHFYDRLPEQQRIPRQEYEQRLRQCRECRHLDSGTCMQCGCYVEVRAAQRKGTCPIRSW